MVSPFHGPSALLYGQNPSLADSLLSSSLAMGNTQCGSQPSIFNALVNVDQYVASLANQATPSQGNNITHTVQSKSRKINPPPPASLRFSWLHMLLYWLMLLQLSLVLI